MSHVDKHCRARRRLLVGGLATSALAASSPLAAFASDDGWPNRPVKLIIPQGAGGGVDIVARLLSPYLSEALGQPVVVENRPGAAANIGTEFVTRAAPDGYTLLFGFNQIVTMNPHIYTRLSFNAAKDLVPITQTSTVGYMLAVNNDLPVRTVAELVAYAKKNPSALAYGTYGPGSAGHLMTEMLSQVAGIEMTHVPYKQPPVPDLIANNIQVLIDVSAVLMPFVNSATVRGLAYTGPTRYPAFPTVPTLSETYPGLDMVGWHAAWAPKNTPRPIIDRVGAELRKIVRMPEIRKKLADNTVEATGTTGEELQAIIDKEYQRWGAVIRDKNIRLD
jgi:tripartite-type tricarboxylate transporter receptor subunit TctC